MVKRVLELAPDLPFKKRGCQEKKREAPHHGGISSSWGTNLVRGNGPAKSRGGGGGGKRSALARMKTFGWPSWSDQRLPRCRGVTSGEGVKKKEFFEEATERAKGKRSKGDVKKNTFHCGARIKRQARGEAKRKEGNL